MTQPLSLSSLPLFPLDAVLFPEGRLNLRIFEVRYLNMVRKCREVGAPFGIVMLTKGHEKRTPGTELEQFSMEGTIALIQDMESPQPGLINLECKGSTRFRIRRYEQLQHGLWIADVRHMPSDPTVIIPQDLTSVAVALEKVLLTVTGTDQGVPLPTPVQLQDCGWVANRWCELLPIPLALKQNLMTLENPLLRLELVSDVLEQTGISL